MTKISMQTNTQQSTSFEKALQAKTVINGTHMEEQLKKKHTQSTQTHNTTSKIHSHSHSHSQKNELPTTIKGGRRSSQDHKTTEPQPEPPLFTPERLRHHLPERYQEGRASETYKKNRVAMYPLYVHTNITAMVPRGSTADLDLQNALDLPTKETWLLNHNKLRCLACLWSPSDRQCTGSPELENKSDFFFVTKYGQGLLPGNMYLVLCAEGMLHSTTWTSFPATSPKLIQYGTMSWNLAPYMAKNSSQIKPAGVKELKLKPNKTLPNKGPLKHEENDDPTVMRSPLSNMTDTINKINSLIRQSITIEHTKKTNQTPT
jgi:hypothetical protein